MDLVFPGDEVADRNGRARFARAYAEKNRLEREGEGRMVLIVGARDYPFPIPLVRRGESWLFDTGAGREEVLSRRIGRNELHTIEVMQAYTDAQREYACLNPEGGSEFARKFTSSEGKRDGLYWKVGEGEAQSPFGPLIARATEEGYRGGLDADPPEPFHGYYFKILEGQGEHAAGGAFDYVVDGRMILGFALVAYPARYGVSGIMTFIVNQEGVIYEKDLGAATDMTASAMTAFDPDLTWNMYREEPADSLQKERVVIGKIGSCSHSFRLFDAMDGSAQGGIMSCKAMCGFLHRIIARGITLPWGVPRAIRVRTRAMHVFQSGIKKPAYFLVITTHPGQIYCQCLNNAVISNICERTDTLCNGN